MRDGLNIMRIADGLLRSMPGVRLVSASQADGAFRVAGPRPDRSALVRFEPDDLPGCTACTYEVVPEARMAAGEVVPQPRDVRLAVSDYWADVYAILLQWMFPEADWPDGAREFKVTRRQIQERLSSGVWVRHILMPGAPLPEELQGFYRMPACSQSVYSGNEQTVLRQLRLWAALGWRARGLRGDAEAGAAADTGRPAGSS